MRNALRFSVALALVLALAGIATQNTSAQRAGNGGRAATNADGGIVMLGDVDSGGNVGEVVLLDEETGRTYVVGAVTNETVIDVSVDAGRAVADSDGRNGNLAGG